MEILSCFTAPSSSSLPLVSVKSMRSLPKQSTYSVGNLACVNIYGLPKKSVVIARHQVDRRTDFVGLSNGMNSQKRRQLLRNIVVRSELAGAESHSAAYPTAEFQLGSKIRGLCFYVVASLSAVVLFVLMVVGHPLVMLFDRHRRTWHHLIAKIWASITGYPFLSVQFEGLENLPAPNAPAVFVSNHQSFLDIYPLLILGRTFKFISKTSIFLFPIIGWAMYLLGTIPLKRMDSRSQVDCLKRCIDLVKKGASVFFFPEGTRSKDGTLGTFKKGAFSIAAKTGVPVVPITLIGTGNLMPVGKEASLKSGVVKVVIHKPIEGNNPDILCEKARKSIADALSYRG
ncbi:hypothetical protein MKX01_011357 [Papaver californicum]|nr:hypothetical protein MKX01_011357 [Papaver californicum]